jgi:hypothetical protein
VVLLIRGTDAYYYDSNGTGPHDIRHGTISGSSITFVENVATLGEVFTTKMMSVTRVGKGETICYGLTNDKLQLVVLYDDMTVEVVESEEVHNIVGHGSGDGGSAWISGDFLDTDDGLWYSAIQVLFPVTKTSAGRNKVRLMGYEPAAKEPNVYPMVSYYRHPTNAMYSDHYYVSVPAKQIDTVLTPYECFSVNGLGIAWRVDDAAPALHVYQFANGIGAWRENPDSEVFKYCQPWMDTSILPNYRVGFWYFSHGGYCYRQLIAWNNSSNAFGNSRVHGPNQGVMFPNYVPALPAPVGNSPESGLFTLYKDPVTNKGYHLDLLHPANPAVPWCAERESLMGEIISCKRLANGKFIVLNYGCYDNVLILNN